jgi:hypothetical protein
MNKISRSIILPDAINSSKISQENSQKNKLESSYSKNMYEKYDYSF